MRSSTFLIALFLGKNRRQLNEKSFGHPSYFFAFELGGAPLAPLLLSPRQSIHFGTKYSMLYFTWKSTVLKRGELVLSFAVVRMIKLKSHDLKGIQFHNQREKESKTNPDIDKSKSAFNYDLLNSNKIDYNKQVKKIIESQKEGTRKIRKDAVLVNEFLVTSDKPFFEKLSPVQEKAFFKESAEFFKERYGEQNIVFATVHIDEKTPHMHIGVVPMRDGRLQGKNVFNRKELLAIQDEFPKHMKEKGFDLDRGELGSKTEHIEIQRLKAMTVREEVQRLEYARETIKEDVQGLIKAVEVSKSVEGVKYEKGGLFDRGSIKLASEDFEQVKTLAKASEGLKRENKRLKSDLEKMKERNETLTKRNSNLVEEKGELKKEISRLKELYEYASKSLKYVKENLLTIKSLRETVNEFIGFAKMRAMVELKGHKNIDRYPERLPEEERNGAQKFIERFQEQQSQKSKSREKDKGMER